MYTQDVLDWRAFAPAQRFASHNHSWLGVLDRTLDWLLDSTGSRLHDTTDTPVRTLFAVRNEQLEAADDLVRRRYAWRGYDVPSAGNSPSRVTLLAKRGDDLLGTLTVRGGTTQELFAENTYAAEINRLRESGKRVGEVVKLAVETGAGTKALQALIRSAYVVTRFMHGLTDVVIEVNPRHVRFYERALGFIVTGAERVCSRVGAPCVLMLLDLEQFGRRIGSLDLYC